MPVLSFRMPVARIPPIPGAGPHIKNAMAASGVSLPELARRTRLTKRRLSQLCDDIRDLTIADAHLIAPALGIGAIGLIMAQQLRTTQKQLFSQLNRQIRSR